MDKAEKEAKAKHDKALQDEYWKATKDTVTYPKTMPTGYEDKHYMYTDPEHVYMDTHFTYDHHIPGDDHRSHHQYWQEGPHTKELQREAWDTLKKAIEEARAQKDQDSKE